MQVGADGGCVKVKGAADGVVAAVLKVEEAGSTNFCLFKGGNSVESSENDRLEALWGDCRISSSPQGSSNIVDGRESDELVSSPLS